jgi:hypothetical protein
MLAQAGVTPGLYVRSLGYLHSTDLGHHGFQSTDQVLEGLRVVPHSFVGKWSRDACAPCQCRDVDPGNLSDPAGGYRMAIQTTAANQCTSSKTSGTRRVL